MGERKTIVVSAVNIVVGGTLTILRDCLRFLSEKIVGDEYRVVAIVNNRDLALYENIDYIEIPWAKKNWANRIWCEYVTMRQISNDLSPVCLWLSLHDTTPNVKAEIQAVYCHNPFPFYRWTWKELWLNYKIVLFAWFSYYIYRVNIYRNRYIIVQQQWIRDAFKSMFGLCHDKIIVSIPNKADRCIKQEHISSSDKFTFLFASSPNSHKNFECLCEATSILENEIGKGKFRVVLTIDGTENRYSQWLRKCWANVDSIEFAGFMSRDKLFGYYQITDCLVFPSKVETWGLPISEFGELNKPMILADEPYSHETASGCQKVSFFNPDDPNELALKMRSAMCAPEKLFSPVSDVEIESPVCNSWKEMFDILLRNVNV